MAHRRNGFTLVELLVVVMIIGLLIGLLMPALSAARRSARGAVCLSNLRQLSIAAHDYVQSQRAYPPFRLKAVDDQGTFVNSAGRAKPRWQWFLMGHVQPVIDPTGFELPFGDGDVSEDGRSGREMTNDYFVDPQMKGPHRRDIRNGSYGYNYQYLGNSRQDGDGVYINWPVGESTIRMPSKTIIFGDSRGAAPRHGLHSYTLDPPIKALDRNGLPMKFGPSSDDGPIEHSPVEMRHNGRGNVAFLDTHVEAYELDELGYEVDDKGVVVPIDPLENPSSRASNHLWTGSGQNEPRPAASLP